MRLRVQSNTSEASPVKGRHHKRHEVGVLVIIPVIGDAPRPLPKGTGYIMRMSFLASKFRDLNFIREPIFFLRLTVEAWLSSESLPL